jgi:indoleamine 2,3-dioxygenase
MITASTIELADFAIDPVTGFLPSPDPLRALPAEFAAWDALGADLPALLLARQARARLAAMPLLDVDSLATAAERERAMLLLSTFAGAYVWGEAEPAKRLPPPLAVPLWRLSQTLGRKPIIAHASNVLRNWRRLDPSGGVTLENLAMLQGFLWSSDESWFVLVTVAIEACGAAALPALVAAQRAAAAGDAPSLIDALDRIAATVERMHTTLLRMYEQCDPYIFYHRVRRFFGGWEAPGVVYEGVSETPQRFSGGSAGQSSLIQALDAGLGVRHLSPDSSPFLSEMRAYMPPPHRRFLEALHAGPDVRAFVHARQADPPQLTERYNRCIDLLDAFRRAHLKIAVEYITRQAPRPEEARGTGGTDLTTFLGATKRETRAHRL